MWVAPSGSRSSIARIMVGMMIRSSFSSEVSRNQFGPQLAAFEFFPIGQVWSFKNSRLHACCYLWIVIVLFVSVVSRSSQYVSVWVHVLYTFDLVVWVALVPRVSTGQIMWGSYRVDPWARGTMLCAIGSSYMCVSSVCSFGGLDRLQMCLFCGCDWFGGFIIVVEVWLDFSVQ